MEPKSGKLYKFGHGIFGPKWTEKWVHLDGHLLKYFSMASEQQPLFTLSSARQSCTVDLALYTFSLHDDKRITRKHAFHLVPTNKTHKAFVFACSSESELKEWQAAFQSRVSSPPGSELSPLVAEKMRRANEVFSLYDPRRTDRIDAAKLRTLLQSISFSTHVFTSFYTF
ncbi:hypothetical protein Poli38472_005319 [Pythium oligandrum]|uniref:PH domain-containing protein n=1 Tax=Pythium oligandrum TaxID=41045 RepID=A0A8K1FHG5_PYTOL|nr:hypothetical protein Poli38472_005319 [Pythium oligandrum]|eukprot:TMW62701.1 hypothetical protein Poli38472_005319 [Pythium oligandrum]